VKEGEKERSHEKEVGRRGKKERLHKHEGGMGRGVGSDEKEEEEDTE